MHRSLGSVRVSGAGVVAFGSARSLLVFCHSFLTLAQVALLPQPPVLFTLLGRAV